MSVDYPAAHSMDTAFFAVDEAGHVGVFDSGESGHVPVGVRDAGDVIAGLWERRFPEEEVSFEGNELAAKLGVFYYEYDGGYESIEPVAAYSRGEVPRHPLHVDQLPPAVRRQAGRLRLEGVDFSRCRLVQPLEHARCVFWDEDAVAYLCGDGKTIRPVPGREHRFADFCEQFRALRPEEVSQYLFEVPKEKPKKPRRRRRKDETGG